eukprot:CAMPEP_0202879076 /NCGR_PEP_ID=MMETSP1391-20130828/33130_1 /ASSEMBLY_ACC=CAM_ASM_000867 /TAXON_ID=1034604 /ORGANISM="Chlamydomonas leiostraca, Strain SAG 11-49" /LENGTH=38 /DNA_ID= /DNA_START= /DNA_END= /DNA_ORIENTATION=
MSDESGCGMKATMAAKNATPKKNHRLAHPDPTASTDSG